ncbi:MAG: hypothetical protein ABJF23_09210 [Bryobacteraceae bacterium]
MRLTEMPYPARCIPFDPRDFATYQSLQRVAAFTKGADAADRQTVIDYVVKAHGFSTDNTKSLLYDPGLDQPGRNVAMEVRIGPSAFEQDLAWLAGIVFHELIHSPQAVYYAARGVIGINPKRSETERRMITLDEYEAYWWSLKRSTALGLSQVQQSDIRRRANSAFVDLDEPKAQDLAKSQRFDAARDELIRQFSSGTGGPRAAIPRRSLAACCG